MDRNVPFTNITDWFSVSAIDFLSAYHERQDHVYNASLELRADYVQLLCAGPNDYLKSWTELLFAQTYK